LADLNADLTLLSNDLKNGESQYVEFKQEFPSQVSALAKEIAAFATSNRGTIYLGITDKGEIIGLDDLESSKQKQEVQQRIEGICGMVDPVIKVNVTILETSDKRVIRILVPKGAKPVYSVKGIPYLRNITSSRQATSQEVEDLYKLHFKGIPIHNHQQTILRDALTHLSDAEIALSTMREQYPKMDRLQLDIEQIGRALGNQLHESILIDLELVPDLQNVSLALRGLGKYKFYIGTDYYERFYSNGEAVLKNVQSLISRIQKNILITRESMEHTLKMLEQSKNNFKNEWSISQNYWRKEELEKLREFFRILTYELNRYSNFPETQRSNLIQDNLSKLSKLTGTLSTSKGFGIYRLGFNNIEYIRNNVETALKMIEDTIALFKK
jgi:hypothetical protein